MWLVIVMSSLLPRGRSTHKHNKNISFSFIVHVIDSRSLFALFSADAIQLNLPLVLGVIVPLGQLQHASVEAIIDNGIGTFSQQAVDITTCLTSVGCVIFKV